MRISEAQAFTLTADGGVFREILTDVGLALPIDQDLININDSRVHIVKALWDTGATNSVITPNAAVLLGLKPSGVANVNHAGGSSLVNTYIVDIVLINNLHFRSVKVSECSDVVGNFDCIIGMDIIARGDFSFTNVGGISVFSFRLPSLETVDYVKDIYECQKYDKIAALWALKGNSKCPCGSSKNFKNCHGKEL